MEIRRRHMRMHPSIMILRLSLLIFTGVALNCATGTSGSPPTAASVPSPVGVAQEPSPAAHPLPAPPPTAPTLEARPGEARSASLQLPAPPAAAPPSSGTVGV